MPQAVTKDYPHETHNRGGKIRSSWNAIRDFYRIRPIPGARAGADHSAISFNDLFREMLADWRILLTGLAAGLLLAALLISTAKTTYEATLTVAPVEASMADTGGGTTVGGGVLTAVFGKAAGQYDDYAQFLDMTHSVRVAARLDTKYQLMRNAFPFDKKRGVFVPPTDVVQRASRLLRWMLGLEPWAPPNMVTLASFLEKRVQIKNGADGTATLSYEGPTPAAAGSFLAHVYQETDDLMRQEKLLSHQNRLDYLSQRLSSTSALEQRTFLIGLWGREQSQMLLLTGGDPVGARMIDDIHVPNMPQNGATLTLAMGALFGLLAGLFAVIGRSAYRRA